MLNNVSNLQLTSHSENKRKNSLDAAPNVSIFDVNNDGVCTGYEKYVQSEAQIVKTQSGIQITIGAVIINIEGDANDFKLNLEDTPYDYVLTNTKTNTKIQFDDALIGDEETKYGTFTIKYDKKTGTEIISIDNYLKGNAPLDDGLSIMTGNVKNSKISLSNTSIRKIDTTQAKSADISLSNCTGDGIFLFNGLVYCKNKDCIKNFKNCKMINIKYQIP